MTEEAKKLIEELQEIAFEYFGMAGVILNAARNIGAAADEHPDECTVAYVIQQMNYRNTLLKHYKYGNLKERESTVWDRLIEELEKES